MVNSSNEKLEGTTLAVYTFAAKAGWPIGTRDVMRGISLSSPSVAYRHLQKLESLGLLSKTEHGEYVVKEKTSIRGTSGLAGACCLGRLFTASFSWVFWLPK